MRPHANANIELLPCNIFTLLWIMYVEQNEWIKYIVYAKQYDMKKNTNLILPVREVLAQFYIVSYLLNLFKTFRIYSMHTCTCHSESPSFFIGILGQAFKLDGSLKMDPKKVLVLCSVLGLVRII